jgi:site-specific DNA recombinase
MNTLSAAIYVRYSSERQSDGYSIEAQLKACLEYCKQKGYTVVATFIEEAESAKTDDRPEFQKMMAEVKKSNFDVVVVHKVDRFARNRNDAALNKAIMKKHKTRLEYVELQLDDSPEAGLLEGVMESIAEWYSRNLGKEVLKGMKIRASKGLWNGGPAPFGYTVQEGKLVTDEKAKAAVQFIYDAYLRGHGRKAIVRDVQAMGYVDFSQSTLRSVLNNIRYTGATKYADIIVPDTHEAIIDIATFEEAQQKRIDNRRTPGAYTAKHKYALSGKIRCSCGAAMIGHSLPGRKGKKYTYYLCTRRHRLAETGKCPSIQGNKVEQYVRDYLEAFLFANTEPLRAAIETAVASEQAEDFTTQIADISKRMSRILSAIEDGVDTPEMRERMKELKAQKEALQSRQNSANNKAQEIEDIIGLIEEYRKGLTPDSLELKEAVQRFVKCVYVLESGEFTVELAL